MRVVFLGTPEVSAVALRAMLRSRHEVVAVVTQPDRPKGRSGAALAPPAKTVALEAGIPVLQPETPKNEAFSAELAAFSPDALGVVAYGHILPIPVLEVAPAINAHFSLLPKYRGAAPVQRAILAGEHTTGVTTFLLEPTMDSGPIVRMQEVAIGEEETSGELLERLAPIGARLLIESLDALQAGTIEPHQQDAAAATPAPKVRPEEAEIDWTLDAPRIFNTIRAFNPAPGAWTTHDGRRLKIWRGRAVPAQQGKPGEMGPGPSLVITCGAGSVEILELQPEGKRRMAGGDFLRGLRPNASRVLGREP